ncbi:CorA family divalent cation transporter [Lactiplantibacillus plantarum]|uniref:CorA family divalent cation transporter n=1 Tax=Lactiplantibacillus plantarum TaxID=1590 RepID=UPI003C1FFA8C
MLQYFTTGKNGLLTTPNDHHDQPYWINVERPTSTEIDQLVTQFDLPKDYLTAILDDAEVSRAEQLSTTQSSQPILIVMQSPNSRRVSWGTLNFKSIPSP